MRKTTMTMIHVGPGKQVLHVRSWDARSTRPSTRRAGMIAVAISLSIGMLATFGAAPVYAQSSDLAKKLLDQAKRLKEEGKLAEACPVLDKSYEFNATDGVLFARADCRDKVGQFATAIGIYEAYLRVYSRMKGATKLAHMERAKLAKSRIADLTPRVPTIKFVWKEPPPPETKVIIDKLEFRVSTLEGSLPLDPGQHEVTLVLPDKPEYRETITLAEGEAREVDFSSQSAAPPPPPPEPVKPPPPPVIRPVTPPTEKPSSLSAFKVGGFVGLGFGLAGVAAGAVLGNFAFDDKKVLDAHCNAEHRCDKIGLAAVSRLQSFGNASTIAFIAGGTVLAAGTTLLVIGYRQSGSTATANLRVQIHPSQTFVGVDGAF